MDYLYTYEICHTSPHYQSLYNVTVFAPNGAKIHDIFVFSIGEGKKLARQMAIKHYQNNSGKVVAKGTIDARLKGETPKTPSLWKRL